MSYKRYLVTFFIVLALFVVAFYFSNQLASKKINEIRAIQDKISTDILSTETRFSLLGTSSCDHVKLNDEFETGLNIELSEMARRVKFMETQLSYDDPQVAMIRDQYALLQIKDYILKKQLKERCGQNIETILYFYGPDCSKCKDQSIVLDEIGSRYPQIRIYWFDINSKTPAMTTLLSMFSVKDVPAVVIKDKYHSGFQSLENIEKYLADFIKKINDAIKAKANLEKAKEEVKKDININTDTSADTNTSVLDTKTEN